MYDVEIECPRCHLEFDAEALSKGQCPGCGLTYNMDHECNPMYDENGIIYDEWCSNWAEWEEFTEEGD